MPEGTAASSERQQLLNTMEISGIRIVTTCDDLPVSAALDPPYAAFSSPASADVSETMSILLRSGGFPDTGPMQKIFDSGQSWSMFVDKGEYFMLFKPAAFDSPVWLARFGREVESVTVYCGEALIRAAGGCRSIESPVRYPLDQLLLMYYLASRQGLLVHAAAMAVGDACLVFPGRSGAGKSTLARQLLSEGASVLTDDRVILRQIDGEFRAFGTPWPGEAGVALNESRPLAGIFFIRHGSENIITRIGRSQALERLLPVCSIPWYDREAVETILGFCETLVSAIPAGEIHFRPGTPVRGLLESFIAGRSA